MPRTVAFPDALTRTISRQDAVVTRDQLAGAGLGRGLVAHRLNSGQWQQLLPGILLTLSGHPTRRQRLVAAYLWAGAGSAIDGPCAAVSHGLEVTGLRHDRVHVVVDACSSRRSHGFVVVRRSVAPITVGARTLVPYVDVATACLVAARGSSRRGAIALLSRALQQGLVDVDELRVARRGLGGRGCHDLDVALAAVGVGLRSPAEDEFRRLVTSAAHLPEPVWNAWLDLGDGRGAVCVDALWLDAGLVHEVNGRQYHAWGRAFDEMQARHDRLTAAGLIVMHNPPSRLRDESAAVLSELVRAHARWVGRGLPPGVRLLQRG